LVQGIAISFVSRKSDGITFPPKSLASFFSQALRNFAHIRDRSVQKALCVMARTLARGGVTASESATAH
jgi:hypothetical protein